MPRRRLNVSKERRHVLRQGWLPCVICPGGAARHTATMVLRTHWPVNLLLLMGPTLDPTPPTHSSAAPLAPFITSFYLVIILTSCPHFLGRGDTTIGLCYSCGRSSGRRGRAHTTAYHEGRSRRGSHRTNTSSILNLTLDDLTIAIVIALFAASLCPIRPSSTVGRNRGDRSRTRG